MKCAKCEELAEKMSRAIAECHAAGLRGHATTETLSEAVCAEPAPTTASAPANSETDHPYCLFCEKPGHRSNDCHATHGINTPRAREMFRLAEGESILREALARLVRAVEAIEADQTEANMIEFSAALEAARSALAGIPLNASGDPTERPG